MMNDLAYHLTFREFVEFCTTYQPRLPEFYKTPGQVGMSVLSVRATDLYNEITGGPLDPSIDDSRLDAFFEFVKGRGYGTPNEKEGR